MKKIPIGISDFKEIIETGYYYIDKSMLIEEILQYGKVILLPRPRRFGKTLNLSMIHYFFERNEVSNEHLFTSLKVWNLPDVKSLQGKFPVIFFTFKDIKESNFQVMLEKFASLISGEYYRHDYLLKSGHLDEFRESLFKRILAKQASQVELTESISFLANLLHSYHKTNVIVLIDEYDMPILEAYLNGYYADAIKFLRSLLSPILKDSKVLEKAVLTGILTLAKEGIFSGLNNLDIFNITQNQCSDKFGFTKEETQKILADYDIKNTEQIKEWYDGYTFGKTHGIYNPWSVLKCVRAQGHIELYWANTSDNALVKNLIAKGSVSLKRNLELLLTQNSITQTIEDAIVFPDLNLRSELTWTLLLFTGYLTFDTCNLVDGKKECSLKIPNQEIRNLYLGLLQQILKAAVTGEAVDELFQSIIEQKTERFTKYLKSFVLNSMSYFDLSPDEPEKTYHLFVLGLLATLINEYQVKSNRESGLGRYDILLFPKKSSLPGIVMELKTVSANTSLEKTADLALRQIEDKKYAQELRAHNVESIIGYGIAFKGKDLSIKSKSL